MNPILIIALIIGGMSGVLTTLILKGGLIAVPAPGSIIAMLAVTPKGGFIATIGSVLISTIITFLLSSIFVKKSHSEENLEEAIEKSKSNKSLNSNDTENKEKNIISQINEMTLEEALKNNIKINKIVVACDAGMGSSAMGATILKKLATEKGIENITIVNSAISNLDDSADIIITQKSLTALAKEKMPNKIHLSINNFMDKNFYKEVLDKIKGE